VAIRGRVGSAAVFRYGVLGASRFALGRMVPAIQAGSGITVSAIASRDPTKAKEAARAHRIPKAHGSYEALLDDPDIDAVYVPLPNHLHVPWSERAAEAKKHVLCEKPIAMDAVEARRLLAARDAHGVLIAEAAMPRVHPRWLRVRELIRQGAIGEPRAFTSTFFYNLTDPADVRLDPAMGGGVLLDVGFYPVTMSRFCFEAEPLAVSARCELHRDVDVLTSALLAFPRAHAAFVVGMEQAPSQSARIVGTKGCLELPQAFSAARAEPTEILIERAEDPVARRVEIEAVNQYTVLAERFAAAARSGAPAPVPLEDSIANMAVLDALRRSARSGRWEAMGV
jgi:predicted dehydrogenase